MYNVIIQMISDTSFKRKMLLKTKFLVTNDAQRKMNIWCTKDFDFQIMKTLDTNEEFGFQDSDELS